MANIVVYGAGQMGKAIAWAMHKLEHDVLVIDKSKNALANLNFDVEKKLSTSAAHPTDTDIVISSLPYHKNLGLVKKCVNDGIKYCDLGGNIEISKQINEYAKQNNGIVFTDLGLAPGLINILAEEAYRKFAPVDAIEMAVGGLPNNPNVNPLGYVCTWSIDGLLNEYKEKCEILIDGEIGLVNPLTGLENIYIKNVGKLEAFYTSGGMSHTINLMKKRGVKYCSYQTLRYPGHVKLLKFLMDNGDIEHILYNVGQLDNNNDMVVIYLNVDGWTFSNIIYGDCYFSAMQQATGFSCASIADWMVDPHVLIHPPQPLNYSHVDFERFYSTLGKLLNSQMVNYL